MMTTTPTAMLLPLEHSMTMKLMVMQSTQNACMHCMVIRTLTFFTAALASHSQTHLLAKGRLKTILYKWKK